MQGFLGHGQNQVGVRQHEHRRMKAGGNQRHPPLQSQGIEGRVDRSPGDATTGHRNVGKAGIALGGDFTFKQGMPFAHQPDKMRGEQVLDLHFRGARTRVADHQVDPPFAQRLIVAIALGHKTQLAVWRLAIEGIDQTTAVYADEKVIGTHVETAPQGA
ncbi:hypothetical protein D3C73_1357400 [compost metagenome]